MKALIEGIVVLIIYGLGSFNMFFDHYDKAAAYFAFCSAIMIGNMYFSRTKDAS